MTTLRDKNEGMFIPGGSEEDTCDYGLSRGRGSKVMVDKKKQSAETQEAFCQRYTRINPELA